MLMHFHAYVPYIQYIFVYLNCLELFWFSLSSLSLSLLFTLMRQWHQNVNLLHPETLFCSKASSSSDPTSSSIWFRNEDARKDFSENFSWRGVHLEHWVILSDFSDIDLPTVIHSRGWESLCDVLATCPFMLIQEFYSNMHEIDSSIPLFHTRVWGMRIVVTPELVSDVLCVLRV